MTYGEVDLGPSAFWTSQRPQEPCSSVMQKLQRWHFDVRALQNGPWAMGGRAKDVMWLRRGYLFSAYGCFCQRIYIYIKTYVDIHPQYHPQCHPINTIPIIPTLTISHPFNTNLPKKTWLSRELAHICVTDHATGVFNVRWMGFYMYMMLYIILFLSHTHIYIYMYI